MREIDETAQKRYGLSVEGLMENAGYQVADFIRQEFSQDVKIGFICGKGHNGGDGLVAARRLLNWGYRIFVYTPYEREELSDLTAKQLERVENLEDRAVEESFPTANVYVDALLGYNHEDDPRDPVDPAVRKMNKWSAETVCIDVPTGIDCDTGEEMNPSIIAHYTVMLGAMKKGLTRDNSGVRYLSDIGFPPEVFGKAGIDEEEIKDIFGKDSLLEVEDIE